MITHQRSTLLRLLLVITLCASVAAAVAATRPPTARAADNRIFFHGKYIYLNGINTPWNDYGRDFGCNYDANYFETMFSQMQGYGVNSTRVWVHTDGRCSPTFAADGAVTGVPANFYAHMDDFLDRAKNHNVAVIPVLWAHELDGRYNNDVTHTDLITDTAKTDSYINNVLIPMVQRYKDHPAVLAWEVINEPEWNLVDEQGNSKFPVTKQEMQRFIGKLAGAIHRNTTQYVTVGAAMYKYMCDKIGDQPPNNAECHGNYWSDAALQTASGDPQATLDFYQVHYYNWQAPYWSFWTEDGPGYYLSDNKPVIIGEWGINAEQGKEAFLNDTYRVGYAGHMAWSYWYDPCCGGGWEQIKHELRAFYDAHYDEITIPLNGNANTPTPLPSPTPTPVCVETQALPIYTDALDANWWNQSWDTTVDFAAAAPVKNGAASAAVTYTNGWAGFSLGTSAPLSLEYGDKLRFWINGGSSGGQKLWLRVNGTGQFNVPAPQTNTWTQIEVPLSEFGAQTQIEQIWLQNATGATQPTYYLDDLQLVKVNCQGGTTPTATSTPVPTNTPTATPTPTAPVRPVLECVVKHNNTSYTAYFGYKNENSVVVTIPVGTKNKFHPNPQDRGQTTTFQPGRQRKVFSVPFNGSNLVWTLDGRTATASKNSARCTP
jgi:hypothetical protein